jgi:flavodoxin I
VTILVAYATNSSGTETVSSIITDFLATQNHTVAHKNIKEVKKDELPAYDLIIFGSPSWKYHDTEGQPHEFFTKFMTENAALTLQDKKFAVYGLGDSAYMTFCGAVGYLEEYVQKIGGQLVVPSLKIDGFYFRQKENTEKILSWLHSLPI